MKKASLFLLIMITLWSWPSRAQTEGFEGLWTNAFVLGISGDGSTVVGGRFGSTDTAFYWRESTGIISIPPLTQSGSDSILWGTNYDGSVAAGYTTSPQFERRAATWTVDGGYELLPPSSDDIFRDVARAISGDGSTIVGHHQPLFSSDENTPQVWINGVLSTPTDIPDDVNLNAVSHDGSIIVGNRGLTFSGDSDGIIWSSELGYRLLDALPGDDRVRVNGISADGSIVVGDSSSVSDGLRRAYAWSVLTGAREVTMLDDSRFTQSTATDASRDGSVIVGDLLGGDVSAPFYWTEETGMVLLQDLLADQFEIALSGWQLLTVAGVSDDGLTFTGTGINPFGNEQAWVATTSIPLPGALLFYLSGLGLLVIKRLR